MLLPQGWRLAKFAGDNDHFIYEGDKPEDIQRVPCQQERLTLAPTVNFLSKAQSWH